MNSEEKPILKITHEIEELDWGGVSLKLKVFGEIPDSMVQEVERFIGAWYIVGFFEGFGGSLHSLDDLVVGCHTEYQWLRWRVDMGSADDSALNALINGFRGVYKTAHWPQSELSIANTELHDAEEKLARELDDR